MVILQKNILKQFDEKYDRRKTGARKWDAQVIKEKFGLTGDAIPLDLADMDFACAEPIKKALVERARISDYSYTYVSNDFYQAVMDWHDKRFNVDVERDWIRLVFGTVSTLHYIVQAFTNQSEAVMIHQPVYDPFTEAIVHNDRKLVTSALLNINGRYEIDFKDMEEKMKSAEVKVLIFCSPHNPGGRVWTAEELFDVAQLCLKYNVLLVSDEVHREMIISDIKFTCILQEKSILDQLILCSSPNKAFNLGGLKTSYVIIPNEQVRETFYAQLLRNAISSPNTFAIPALTAAYNEGESWLDDCTEYIKGNYQLVYDFFEKNLPKAQIMRAEASFLAWIDMRQMFEDEAEILDFFARVNLTVVKGSYFGKEGYGFARIVIAMSREVLLEVLERLKTSYDMWEAEK